MTAASKCIAAFVVVGSTITLYSLFTSNEDFRVFYWMLVGQDITYASLGAVTMLASIIAAGRILWNRN